MYKAVVVDDEKMIRDGIRDTIRWDQVGIEEGLYCGEWEEGTGYYNRKAA